jgi:alkylation response protein AidB-like acyl-CoA dehydrogenase
VLDRFELRRHDYSLSAEQQQLKSVLRDFLGAHCPVDVVRRAEPLGFDAGLWGQLAGFGATRMALPSFLGGDDADLVDLVLLAEEVGRAAAPAPVVDHIVTSRLLAAHLAAKDQGPDGGVAALPGSIDWDEPLGIAVSAEPLSQGYLVTAGAVAGTAVVLAGSALELWHRRPVPAATLPLAGIPAAWWPSSEQRSVLAEGKAAQELHKRARTEWKLLTAASLLGMVDACLADAVEFAKTRYTRGVPIGTLQAISHPLADMAIALVSGRHLLYRAAWMLEHEPGARPDLPPAAFVFAAQTAMRAVETAVHVQGGLGFTRESAVSLYFLRARSLVAAGGDLGRDVLEVVDGLDELRGRQGAGAPVRHGAKEQTDALR